MASVSGLSLPHRIEVRDRAVHAAMLGVKNAASVHYTQGPQRWEGIAKKLNARMGQYPNYADCSAFVTWCLWNGLVVPKFPKFVTRDIVNGANWTGGYTGTLLAHGKEVHHLSSVQRADVVIYGNGGTGEHTAIIVGRRADGHPMVVSHGSEPAPFFCAYDYRKDIMCIRRYV